MECRYFVGNDVDVPLGMSSIFYGIFDSQDGAGGEFPVRTGWPETVAGLWAALDKCRELNGGENAEVRLTDDLSNEKVLRLVSDGPIRMRFSPEKVDCVHCGRLHLATQECPECGSA